jgi:hypothetical protein
VTGCWRASIFSTGGGRGNKIGFSVKSVTRNVADMTISFSGVTPSFPSKKVYQCEYDELTAEESGHQTIPSKSLRLSGEIRERTPMSKSVFKLRSCASSRMIAEYFFNKKSLGKSKSQTKEEKEEERREEEWSPLDLAKENTVRHEFDFRRFGNIFVEANLIADVTFHNISFGVVSRGHSQLNSDAIGDGDGGHTTRLRNTHHSFCRNHI